MRRGDNRSTCNAHADAQPIREPKGSQTSVTSISDWSWRTLGPSALPNRTAPNLDEVTGYCVLA